MSTDVIRSDKEEAEFRAEWLHRNKAPSNWLILTADEICTIRHELNAAKTELEKLKAKPLGNWNNSLLDYDPYDPT